MKETSILFGIFFTIFGIYSLYAAIKNKNSLHFEMPSGTYLAKKIFGKHFNKYHNFFWGIVYLIVGVGILLHYANQLL